MLTSPSSAVIDSSRTGYRPCTKRRPSLQQLGPPSTHQESMERRCVTSHRLRRLAPHSPPLRGSAVLRGSPDHPRVCGDDPAGFFSFLPEALSTPDARGATWIAGAVDDVE